LGAGLLLVLPGLVLVEQLPPLLELFPRLVDLAQQRVRELVEPGVLAGPEQVAILAEPDLAGERLALGAVVVALIEKLLRPMDGVVELGLGATTLDPQVLLDGRHDRCLAELRLRFADAHQRFLVAGHVRQHGLPGLDGPAPAVGIHVLPGCGQGGLPRGLVKRFLRFRLLEPTAGRFGHPAHANAQYDDASRRHNASVDEQVHRLYLPGFRHNGRGVAEMVVRSASAGCLPTPCAASLAGVEPGTRFSLETDPQRTSGTNHTQPPQVWLRGGFPAFGGWPRRTPS